MDIRILHLIEGARQAEGLAVIDERLKAMKSGGGAHFFNPDNQEVYPEEDFWMCIDRDRFGFVIRIERDKDGYLSVQN